MNSRFARPTMPATRSRWSPRGIRPATCATSSKPFASPRREESSHDPSSFPCAFVRYHRHRRSGFHVSKRGAGLLHASGGDRGVQAGTESRGGAEQLHGLPLRADYIDTQPRGPKFKKDFWQAEVTKMIKVYGAPIDDADAAKIVDYLAATY